ncbi:MAG TPA: cation diffusion facilitator family transporter [Ignavibacteriaceae bacterium]|nr:cation diffusion facilitator family transporter [Ignavibacteriaceae bacterium]
MSIVNKGLKTVLIGVLINSILAAIKIISGIVGNSYALIADGIESTTDIFSSLIVYGGIRIASKPPDENHPWGHGKAESLAALVVSVALIAAAVGIAFQSIGEIFNPRMSPAPFTLIVLTGVIIIKEFLFRRMSKLGEEAKSTAMTSDAWHHRSDAITSAAAFIGISISLLFNIPSADDWAALLASFIIAFNGIRIMRFALYEVMDAASPATIENEVRKISNGTKGVVHVEKCFIRKSGFHYLVDIHISVDSKISVYKGHEIAHRLKDNLMGSNLSINNVMVHVEPDDYSLKDNSIIQDGI